MIYFILSIVILVLWARNNNLKHQLKFQRRELNKHIESLDRKISDFEGENA